MHAMTRVLAAALLALILLTGTARAERHTPQTAFLLALGPGALFHGLGNRYAGERKTANLLFVTELFGLALLAMDHPKGSLDGQVGDEPSRTLSGGELETLGRVLFFGSWLYDLASAPDAARRHRARRARQGLELQLEPRPDPVGGRVSFNPRAAYTVRF